MTLFSPPPVRTDVSTQLRSIVLAHIVEQGRGEAQAAEALGVLPSTADSLLAYNPWEIELAISVADRLGIDVHVDPVRGGAALDLVEALCQVLTSQVEAWTGNACAVVDVTESGLADMVRDGDPLATSWREAVTIAGPDLAMRLRELSCLA